MKHRSMAPVAEINQAIVDHINNALQAFCFGEYEEETTYPVALTKMQITSVEGHAKCNVMITAKKKDALLTHVHIRVV